MSSPFLGAFLRLSAHRNDGHTKDPDNGVFGVPFPDNVGNNRTNWCNFLEFNMNEFERHALSCGINITGSAVVGAVATVRLLAEGKVLFISHEIRHPETLDVVASFGERVTPELAQLVFDQVGCDYLVVFVGEGVMVDDGVTPDDLVSFWAEVDARDAARGLAPVGSVERAVQAAWIDLGGVLA